MRLTIASAALLLSAFAPAGVLAQTDPWGAPQTFDPYQGQGEGGLGGFELPQGNELAPSAEGVPQAESAPEPRIENRVAVFSGLDKITGRITTFDVYVDETVQFGALQVTPRACYSAPPEAPPKTDTFVEVDEITLERDIRRIFTGWMFADSPGLNAVEHPVYDVWLRECKMESDVPSPSG